MQEIAEIIHQQGYCIVDDYLETHYFNGLQILVNSHYSNGLLKKSKIGSQQSSTENMNIRNDEILWLEEEAVDDPHVSAYFAAMNKLKQNLNQELFLGLMKFEAHFAAYQPGSFYKKHIDQFKTKQDRRISCVFYLNNDWKPEFGGELLLYDQKNSVLARVLPTANRFVCFRSDIPHEVLPTMQARYSIAGWFKVRTNIF
jgi:SM-20-related protein